MKNFTYNIVLVYTILINGIHLIAQAPNGAGIEQPNPIVSEKPPESPPIKRMPKKYIVPKGVKLNKLEENYGKRIAITIGINNYNDTGISDLSKARNDAKVIAKILKTTGQFNEVFVMTDDVDARKDTSKSYPTKRNIEERVENISSNASKDDLVIFFYSGHGISDYEENGFILPVDVNNDKKYETSISVPWIVKQFKDKGIKKFVLILDACRDVPPSTSKNASRDSIKENPFEEGEVAATFYSTKAGFYSYEDDESDYGVFTKYLVYGLEGKADTNHDTVVSFFELEKYVEEGVKSWSMKKGKNQKPYTKIHEDKHGDLILSYASNPDKSLVDQRLPKTLVGFDYAFRSAILPGWGQWYGDHKYKAGGYFLVTAVFLANFAQKRNVFKAEQKEFNSIPLVPYNWNENALFINQINVSNGKRNLLNAENNFFIAGYALGAIWGINILDAYIFKTAIKNPLAIHFNTKIDPVTFRREASIQGINPVLYSIEFQMKF